jgi:hypothetical protein
LKYVAILTQIFSQIETEIIPFHIVLHRFLKSQNEKHVIKE